MAGKRSNGEGTLRKRPNGLWECTMMVGYRLQRRRHTPLQELLRQVTEGSERQGGNLQEGYCSRALHRPQSDLSGMGAEMV